MLSASAYAFPPFPPSSTATQVDSLTDLDGEGTANYVLTDDGDGTYTMKLLTEDNLAATLDISGKTVTFGLEASDIPDISATYQSFHAYLTDIAGLSLSAGDILYFDGSDIVNLGEGSNDGYVLAINTSTHAPYWKVDSTGAGGDQLVDIVTTAPITINGTTHVDNILPGSDADITFAIGDAAADGSTKGAAAFTASHFDTASGVVSLDTTNGPDAFLDNCLLSPTGGTWDLSSVTLTLPSYDTTPAANPAMTLYDSDAPGSELADKMVARIYAEYIDGAEDSENSDVGFQAMQDGSLVTFALFDESDDQLEMKKKVAFEIMPETPSAAPTTDYQVANKKYVDDNSGGSGSMTTVKEADSQVGGSDIVTLDFGAGFDITEDPDTEINIVLDCSEQPNADLGDVSVSSGSWTIDDDAVQPDDIEYIVETEYLPIGYAIDGDKAPATKETLTSTYKVDVRKFDGASQDEDVYYTWQAPDDLDTTSGVKFRVLCMVSESTAPSAETWQFEVQGFSSGTGDGLAGTLGTAQTSNSGERSDAQYDFVYTAWSSAMTSTHITDLAAGEVVTLKLYRDIDDTDTYAQDIAVIGIELRYKRNPVTTF